MGCKTNGKHMLTHFESRFSGCESCVCLRIFYDFVWKICQIDPTQRNNKGGNLSRRGRRWHFVTRKCNNRNSESHISLFTLPKEQRSLRSVLGLVQLLCQGPGTVKREVIVIVIVMLDPSWLVYIKCRVPPLEDCWMIIASPPPQNKSWIFETCFFLSFSYCFFLFLAVLFFPVLSCLFFLIVVYFVSFSWCFLSFPFLIGFFLSSSLSCDCFSFLFFLLLSYSCQFFGFLFLFILSLSLLGFAFLVCSWFFFFLFLSCCFLLFVFFPFLFDPFVFSRSFSCYFYRFLFLLFSFLFWSCFTVGSFLSFRFPFFPFLFFHVLSCSFLFLFFSVLFFSILSLCCFLHFFPSSFLVYSVLSFSCFSSPFFPGISCLFFPMCVISLFSFSCFVIFSLSCFFLSVFSPFFPALCCLFFPILSYSYLLLFLVISLVSFSCLFFPFLFLFSVLSVSYLFCRFLFVLFLFFPFLFLLFYLCFLFVFWLVRLTSTPTCSQKRIHSADPSMFYGKPSLIFAGMQDLLQNLDGFGTGFGRQCCAQYWPLFWYLDPLWGSMFWLITPIQTNKLEELNKRISYLSEPSH